MMDNKQQNNGPHKETIKTNVTIINDRGLHARASAKFVTLVQRMPKDLDIYVAKNDQKVVGHSIMGLMMLGAAKGSDIDIIIEFDAINKEHAAHALKRLEGLIIDGFGED